MPATLTAPPKPAGTTTAATRRQELREHVFPGSSTHLWNRKTAKGFCTIPRSLPLVMALIDLLAEKGKPASAVYFDLWCRAFDDYLVEVSDEETFAFSSGYTSGRGVRSWRERIMLLERLGFIRVAPNGVRSFGFALIVDPHNVVEKLRSEGTVPDNWWGAYSKRGMETGYQLLQPHSLSPGSASAR